MLWVLILALELPFGPQASATPPPIIITTKSSPLCTAVSEIIGPAVTGLEVQDRIIDHGDELMRGMTEPGPSFTLDNVRLGTVVYHLAANNIALHQSLDQLATLHSSDPHVVADLDRLHERLLNVADAQAGTLNIMSGIAQTNDLAALARVGGSGRAARGLTAFVEPKTLAGPIADYERQAEDNEAAMLPALIPIVNRCR